MREMLALFLSLLACAYAYDGQAPVQARMSQPKPISADEFGALRAEDNKDFADPEIDEMNEKEFNPELREPYADGPRDPLENENGLPGKGMTEADSERRARLWFDFVASHDLKVVQPRAPPFQRKMTEEDYPPPPPPVKLPEDGDGKDKYFFRHNFDLNYRDENELLPQNWTTCDEFKQGAEFHPDDVVGKTWVSFYVWHLYPGAAALVYKFTQVTQKKVKMYHNKFIQYLNKTIDWNRPKLILQEGGLGQRESLLIAGDQQGLFYVVVDAELPEYVIKNNITLPIMAVRFKMVKRFLAMMYCDEYFASMLAVSGLNPKSDENKSKAAKLVNFRGRGYPVERDFEEENKMRQREREVKAEIERLRRPLTDPEYGMFPPSERPKAERRHRKNRIRTSNLEDKL